MQMLLIPEGLLYNSSIHSYLVLPRNLLQYWLQGESHQALGLSALAALSLLALTSAFACRVTVENIFQLDLDKKFASVQGESAAN